VDVIPKMEKQAENDEILCHAFLCMDFDCTTEKSFRKKLIMKLGDDESMRAAINEKGMKLREWCRFLNPSLLSLVGSQ
jgi:hypothetical protein